MEIVRRNSGGFERARHLARLVVQEPGELGPGSGQMQSTMARGAGGEVGTVEKGKKMLEETEPVPGAGGEELRGQSGQEDELLAHDASQTRMLKLMRYGLARAIDAGAPSIWCARIWRDLHKYLTSDPIAESLPLEDTRERIRARVDRTLERWIKSQAGEARREGKVLDRKNSTGSAEGEAKTDS